MAVNILFQEGQLGALNNFDANEKDPKFFDVVGAQLGYTYQPIINQARNEAQFGNVETDFSYDPRPDIEGYEQYFDTLVHAKNSEHMSVLKSQLFDLEDNREVMARAGFWTNVGAGFFDPVNLIALPFGGATIGLARSAVRGGVAAGTTQAFLEGIRAPYDPTGTFGEAALNIGATTVFGALLNSAVSIPLTRRADAFRKTEQSHKEFLREAGITEEVNTLTANDVVNLRPREERIYKGRTDQNLDDTIVVEEQIVFGSTKRIEEIDETLKKNMDELDDEKIEDLLREQNALTSKKSEAEISVSNINRERALRKIEDAKIEGIDDPYDLAPNLFINSPFFKFIPTPIKSVLQSDAADSAKKAILQLTGDSGLLLVMNKFGLSIGPSVLQKAKLMEGEWVTSNNSLIRLWSESLGIKDPSRPLGINVNDAIERVANVARKRRGKEPSGRSYSEWLTEVNNKRINKVDNLTDQERQAANIIDDFFGKYADRLEEVGLLGTEKSIDAKVRQNKIKLERAKETFANFEKNSKKWRKKYKANFNKINDSYRNRIVNLTRAIEEDELSLENFPRGIMPANEDVFMPRYWDIGKIKKNRADLEKIIAEWYMRNPTVYVKENGKYVKKELDGSVKAAEDRAKKTVDNILGIKDIVDPEQIAYGYGKSKHLRHRELDIPNSLVLEFIHTDPMAIMKAYAHRTGGIYQFHKMYGGRSVKEVVEDTELEMLIAGNSAKDINTFKKNFKGAYDRIAGSPVRNFDRIDFQAAQIMKDLAYMNYMGAAGFSAIPDFSRIIMEHELGDVLKGLLDVFDKNTRNLNRQELDGIAEAIEILQGSAHLKFTENMTNNPMQSSAWDTARSIYNVANLLGPVTQISKELDGLIRGHTLVSLSKKWTAKEKNNLITQQEASYLARYNITEEIAREIAEAPVQHSARGLYIPNTSSWSGTVRFPDHTATIVTGPTNKFAKDGRYVPAFYNKNSKKIFIDEDYIRGEYYESRVWAKDSTKVEGVKGLPEGFIKSPDDLVQFVKMHEIMHNKNSAKSLGFDSRTKQGKADYENAINKLAIEEIKKHPRISEETTETFRSALQSGILNTIMMGTPADKPLITDGVVYVPHRIAKAFGYDEDDVVTGYSRMESGILGLPFQFFSYAFAAMNKVTGAYSQGQIKNRAAGVITAMGLGYMSIAIKSQLSDGAARQWDEMSYSDRFARSFDQSGLAAMYSDILYTSINTSMALGGGNFLEGVIEPKFPQEPNMLDAFTGVMGAGPSIAADLTINPIEDFLNGNAGEGLKTFTRNLPFMRLWLWKGDMNAITLGMSRSM